jgi:HlyD family secretion protein
VTQAQAQEQAAVATASSNIAQAKGSSSTAVADDAAIGVQQAQVAAAQYNLNNTIITSPVNGTVIARDVSIGQTVAASLQTPTLFSIAQDLTKMEVDLQVGEPDIGNVRPGDQVSFSVLAYPTRTFTGTVSQVRLNPTTVNNVVTYTAVVLVDNKDGALMPGMTANATIGVASLANATIVPIAALQWHAAAAASGSPWGTTGSTGNGTVVAGTRGRVFVQNGRKLQMIPVNIAMVSGTSAAVTPLHGTLSAGEGVVVAGGATAHAHAAQTSNSPFNARPTGMRVGGGGYGR